MEQQFSDKQWFVRQTGQMRESGNLEFVQPHMGIFAQIREWAVLYLVDPSTFVFQQYYAEGCNANKNKRKSLFWHFLMNGRDWPVPSNAKVIQQLSRTTFTLHCNHIFHHLKLVSFEKKWVPPICFTYNKVLSCIWLKPVPYLSGQIRQFRIWPIWLTLPITCLCLLLLAPLIDT